VCCKGRRGRTNSKLLDALGHTTGVPFTQGCVSPPYCAASLGFDLGQADPAACVLFPPTGLRVQAKAELTGTTITGRQQRILEQLTARQTILGHLLWAVDPRVYAVPAGTCPRWVREVP
jgi:hypothetical protein